MLAREMKDAAARDVDASLRLEQLKEVFGAEELDAGERARIQTALQMAGLEPRPSLLEADPADPIRFAVDVADAAPAPEPAVETPAPERQEFPTVGEFFGRFRRKRRGGGDDEVITAVEPQALEPEAEEPEEPEWQEPELLDEPEPELEPEPTLDPEPELQEPLEAEHEELEAEEEPPSVNGHVDVESNGHSHLDLDDVALPPHETATPADFGASAETIDFDDPRVEEELLYEADEHDEAEYDVEGQEEEEHWEPELEPEPVQAPEQVIVAPAPQGARVEEIAALLLPLVAIPVLISSFAGWTFGLPFVALSVIATGFLAGRRKGFFATLRESPAARTIFKTAVLVTAASAAVGIVLASAHTGGGKSASSTTPKPAPKAKTPTTARKATPPAAKHRHHTTPTTPSATKPPKAQTTPASPPPDNSTKGLIRVPPPSSSTGANGNGNGQTQTPTTPAPQQPTH